MEEIFRFLKREDLCKEPGWGDLKIPFEIKPKDFIKFAEDDIKEESKRSSVNALSNIKRSIDCQIDLLLYTFGYYNKSKKEDWSFPKKAKLLKLLRLGKNEYEEKCIANGRELLIQMSANTIIKSIGIKVPTKAPILLSQLETRKPKQLKAVTNHQIINIVLKR